MNPLFNAVARTLNWIASVTGFTYNEINIIAYYIVIPFVYVVLLDRIIHKHVLKIAYIFVWVTILVAIRSFSEFCNALFKVSVDFLLKFSAVGLDYVAASVVIVGAGTKPDRDGSKPDWETEQNRISSVRGRSGWY